MPGEAMQARLELFARALDAEIAYLKKRAVDQLFELSSGRRDPHSKGPGGIYSFILGDGSLRLPEDASGTLRSAGKETPAFVVSHDGSRIWLLVEAVEELPALIPSAQLVISETELLEQLRDLINELAKTPSVWNMAPKVFGHSSAKTGVSELSSGVSARVGDGAMSAALRQAAGSEVTFLWGPPGTGKTFSIAALVAHLAEAGETVLVTSHTHAAVEQALWAAIEPPSPGRPPGLLAGSSMVSAGQILKVGVLRDPKIPRDCHLEGRIEAEAERREAEASTLLAQLVPLHERVVRLQAERAPWLQLGRAEKATDIALSALSAAERAESGAAVKLQAAQGVLGHATAAQSAAGSSFLIGRRGRIERAEAAQAKATSEVETTARAHASASGEVAARRAEVETWRGELAQASAALVGVRPVAGIEAELTEAEAFEAAINAEVDALRGPNADLAGQLLDNARVLFVTMSKLFKETKFRRRTWDTVIVDEASMAMPPLVAWAASRARQRVVICGDFHQLPPIVHDREGLPGEVLGRDLFDIAGIPTRVKAGQGHPQLAQLMVQRRMHPAIAEVARTLAYGSGLRDHPDTVAREAPKLVEALGVEPLEPGKHCPNVVVDTSSLRPWSGRVRGSMSRFNFYSAQAAVELAALYAAACPRPDPNGARPIGIITPFAAQRRYLAKLVEAFGELDDWVSVGTVHTFQGSECDVVIFDTVVGEPHWSSRLVDPNASDEVLRDLNVAVTRARHQFVLLGDRKWLDAHAKPGSALGTMWNHLRATAPIVEANRLLDSGLLKRIASGQIAAAGWGPPDSKAPVTFHTDASFYPAFLADLAAAQEQVVLYTAFIGKTRWPQVAPHIEAAASRGIEVIVMHKPLSDPDWQTGDPRFGKQVFDRLAAAGVRLVPVSGVHAKSIIIDGRIVYEGSLNWASQTASHEHMLRIESREVAALYARMNQLDSVIPDFRTAGSAACSCPRCGGPLVLINLRQPRRDWGDQPLKLGCLTHEEDPNLCPEGYLRSVGDRLPFAKPPQCDRGQVMEIRWDKNGKPHSWVCTHKSCRKVRWKREDVVVGEPQKRAPQPSGGRR